MQFCTPALRVAALALLGATASSIVVAEGNSQHSHYDKEWKTPIDGPAEWFTGEVTVDPVFPSNDIARYSGAYVTFSAGARTIWHEHPAGQHIVVTDGTALVGTRDGSVVEFHEGEAVWCPPDMDHWHAATPDAPMTHFVVTAFKDGENVVWKEKVTDETYQNALKTSE